MQTKPIAVSAPRLDLIFEQRHTSSAHYALELVGRRVIPTAMSERAQRARGLPRAGVVTGICIPDLAHTYVIVAFGTDVELMFPHDLNLLPKTQDAAQLNYASSNPVSHGETPVSDVPDHLTTQDFALNWIMADGEWDERFGPAIDALEAAEAASEPGIAPDLRSHLSWALGRIGAILDILGMSARSDTPLAELAAIITEARRAGACDA